MPLGDDGAAAGLYRLSIFKYRNGAPERQWVNSYEFRVTEAINFTSTLTVMLAFSNFEKYFHSQSVGFDRAVLSTWAADSTPYNADEFLTLPLSGSGLRPIVGDPLPLEVAVLVRRAVSAGRSGKIFYRGCLGEGEVNAPAGVIQFTNSAFANRLADALPTVNPYTSTGGPAPFPVQLVMINRNTANQTIVRQIAALQLVSPRIRSRSTRWYNRNR